MELRRRILTAELAPGVQVLQEAFAEELGVSRVPVREALKILAGEGLVRYKPQHGYFVTEHSGEELLEVYRIRQLLEAEAVRVGLGGLTLAGLAAMDAEADAVESAARQGDVAALIAANRRFHFTLFEASGRKRLVRLISQLWDAAEPYRASYFADQDNRATVPSEHRELAAAARRGSVPEVVRLLDAHRGRGMRALQGTEGFSG